MNDTYLEGLLKITGMYGANKETIRSMINNFSIPVTVLNTVYYYLVSRKEIDPIDSVDRKQIAYYLLEII